MNLLNSIDKDLKSMKIYLNDKTYTCGKNFSSIMIHNKDIGRTECPVFLHKNLRKLIRKK